MHEKTESFMSRLRKRTHHAEEGVDARLASIRQRHQEDTDPQNEDEINTGPAWIDTSDVDAYYIPKGDIVDLLNGKTKVKSSSQRG